LPREQFSETILWRTILAAAIIIIIGASFYAEENARGLRTWQKAEKEITARGESLNLDGYIPRPVPERSNLTLFSKLRMLFQETVVFFFN
jgi:hypothetical protein